MDPLLCLIPGSFVHLLLLLVLTTGIPLSKGTARVHLSQHASLSQKLSAGLCPKNIAVEIAHKSPAKLENIYGICPQHFII